MILLPLIHGLQTFNGWLAAVPTEPAALFVAPGVEEDFGGVQLLPAGSEGGAGAVVIGDMGAGWDYGALNRAFRCEGRRPTGWRVR